MRFGVNARNVPMGEVPCIQARNFGDNGRLDCNQLSMIPKSQLKRRDILKSGEILFAAKGSRNFAVVWKEELPLAVASSTFIVMTKKNEEEVLPSYLAWYLMSAKASRYFDTYAKEGTVKSINKKSLDMMEIKIPPLEDQQRVVRLFELFRKEQELMEQISSNRKKIILNL